MRKKSETKVKDVINLWLDYIKISVKASTLSTYQVIIKNHIIKSIGDLYIENLSKQTIDSFIIQQYTNGRADGKGGLSAKTVLNISAILTSVLKFACDNKYIKYYPCSIVRPRQEMKEIEIFTETEQKKLEYYIQNHLDYKTAGIIISLYTGIRIGELCALTVQDVDFNSGILKINKSIQRIKNLDKDAKSKTKIIIDTPKSKKTRYIPLSPAIINLLAPLYRHVKPEYYILTGTKNYIEPRAYTNIFKKCLEESKVREVNFHALRHTFATRCIEENFDIKTLSEILGHSDVRTTLNTYVHSSYKLKCKHMKKLQLLCG